jgi:hypothetical protein
VRRRRGAGLLRGLTGLLAGGLVALVVALALTWVVAERVGVPGPGTGTVAWHIAAAAAAVLAQREADRRRDRVGTLAALAVVAIAAAVLTVMWLA